LKEEKSRAQILASETKATLKKDLSWEDFLVKINLAKEEENDRYSEFKQFKHDHFIKQ
jgi:hypothetical protein